MDGWEERLPPGCLSVSPVKLILVQFLVTYQYDHQASDKQLLGPPLTQAGNAHTAPQATVTPGVRGAHSWVDSMRSGSGVWIKHPLLPPDKPPTGARARPNTRV